jgi:branched-chain amino acid transport system ATP-binding protein
MKLNWFKTLALATALGAVMTLPAAAQDVIKIGVAHVPEGRGTFAPLTVEENLRLGAYTRRGHGPMERVFSLFPRLEERRRQRAGTLSGGEQQMLAIGRALMLQPKLMLLDEPSLGLAPNLTRELFKILRRIKEDEGTGMLIVEQNANLVLEFADAAHVLETGSIVLSGTAEEVRQDETMRKAYLGY